MTIYSDIDQNFLLNENGDIGVLTELDAIKQAIENIIMTPIGHRTRYQDPFYGCGVRNLIGEKMNTATEILIQEEIESALKNYEPRVKIIEVTVDSQPDTHTYNILIKYKVLSVNIDDELNIDLGVLK